MPKIDTALLYEIRRQLDAAEHGAKDAALQPYADQLGVSVATVRRQLRKQYGRAKETTGRPRTISDELLDAVWDEKVAGREMGLQAREIPTRICLDRLAAAGFPGAAEASPTGINNAIKRAGYRRTERRQRIEPDFALDTVHLDFSRSKYFQLHTFDGAAGDHVLRVYGRHLGYKEEDKVLRTWIASTVDGHSRLARMQCFAATGEDAGLALRALAAFWNVDQADGHPFHHPPRTLWVDRGSAGRTEGFVETLARADVEVNVTQSKEAQGKVERQFRTLWSAFELPLALELGQGSYIHLGDYNERLNAFLLEQADWHHPTKPVTRREAFASSVAQVRPDGSPVERLFAGDLMGSFHIREERVVDVTGCVTYKRQPYLVPEQVGPHWIDQGARIRIYQYADGSLYGSLVDHPGEQPFQLSESNRAASHPVGRSSTPTTEARDRVSTRQPQADRIADRMALVGQADAEERAPSRPTPSRIELAKTDDGPTVFAFRRPPETIQPEGPREEAHAESRDAMHGPALRTYVGRRLAPYGLGYADVADVFAPLESDPQTTQRDADLVISALISAHNRVA